MIITLLASLSLAVSACGKKPVPVANTNQDVNQAVNQDVNTNIATTTAEIDTSGWKTYRNEEYGFEFKYPEEIGDVKFILNFISGEKFYGLGEKITVIVRPLLWQDYMFAIAVYDKSFIRSDFNRLYSNHWISKKININNKNINGKYMISGSGGSAIESYALFIEGKNFNFEIVGGGCSRVDVNNGTCFSAGYTISVVDKILSTLVIQ